MRRYRFHRLHAPTGERSVGEVDAMSERDFLFNLNDWNRAAMECHGGAWFYWTTPDQLASWRKV